MTGLKRRHLLEDDISILLILFRRDPHLLEGTKTSQDTTTNPRSVLSFWWSVNLDLHVSQCQLLDLCQETISKAFCKCRTTTQDDVAKEILPQVEVGSVDTVHDELMYARVFRADELRIKEDLWSLPSFSAELREKGGT